MFKKRIEEEIDIDVYNKSKSLEIKEKELLKKEKELLEKEKELLEKEKKINSTIKDKTFVLVQLKTNNNYWIHCAFKDLIVDGDLDKLEWIKNNEPIIHFGVIDKAITHHQNNIRDWFNYYYFYLKTIKNFRILLKFDIVHNNIRNCRIYTNLTTAVLFWYKKCFNNPRSNLNEIILDVFEYAIKCNNSLIIEWFENNFEEFEELSHTIIPFSLKIMTTYYDESMHRFYGYKDDLRDVHNQEWFKKYLAKYIKYQIVNGIRSLYFSC